MDDSTRDQGFEPQTAAALMRTDFIRVPCDMTTAQALDLLKQESHYPHFYNAYVTDTDDLLLGVIGFVRLLSASPNQTIKSLALEEPISVPPEMDQEDMAKIVSEGNLVELPVVRDGRIVGVISVDDVVDVLIQEHTEDVFRIQGLEHSPLAGKTLTNLSVWQHVRARMPWLLLSLVGGLIAASIIDRYEAGLEGIIIALVLFVPFIMALGGNIGSQSATLFVRELAIGSVQNTAVYFLKEIGVGVIIGVIIGLIIGPIAWLWLDSSTLAWIVGLASLLISVAAALLGVFIPWVFDRFGLDAALGSGPIVTTLKDITGLLIYFSTAIAIVRLLEI